MRKIKLPMPVLLTLQAIAIILYPLSYFKTAPQAAVLPPVLLLFLILAVVGFNAGTLSQPGARILLVFSQGVNIVIRLMTLLPNLKTSGGEWAWTLAVAQIIGIGLSWYTMIAMEHRSLEELPHRKSPKSVG